MPRPFRLIPDNPLETDRLEGIQNYLKRHPKVHLFIRINGGGGKLGNRWMWFYRLFQREKETQNGKGVTDIIGMLKDGRFFAIEAKRHGEKPTEEQAGFIAMVRAAGGIAGVAETWIDVEKLLAGETKCPE